MQCCTVHTHLHQSDVDRRLELDAQLVEASGALEHKALVNAEHRQRRHCARALRHRRRLVALAFSRDALLQLLDLTSAHAAGKHQHVRNNALTSNTTVYNYCMSQVGALQRADALAVPGVRLLALVGRRS